MRYVNLILIQISLFHLMPIFQCVSQENKTSFKWEIAYHKTEEQSLKKWMPATVPGAVQLDVMKAESYKQPYWFGDNFKQFDWMEDWFFTYRTMFKRPSLGLDQRVYFSY